MQGQPGNVSMPGGNLRESGREFQRTLNTRLDSKIKINPRVLVYWAFQNFVIRLKAKLLVHFE